MNWYIEVLKKYATFDGRASRSEYWYFFLFNALIELVLVAIMYGIPIFAGIISFLLSVYSIVIFLPSLAVGVRRLHDIGKSGWWYLIIFIPLIGAVILLVFAVLDSQPGSNTYGPNPKKESKNLANNKTVESETSSGGANKSLNTQQLKRRISYGRLLPENNIYPIIDISGRVVVGRSGDIRIDNTYVSGRHFSITANMNTAYTPSAEYYITDLGSTNGTYIDGRKLDENEEVQIFKGQRIIVGSEDVVYQLES